MVDSATPLHAVKNEMSDWVDALDFDQMGRRVQEFGREKPFALAIAALTVGIAAGLLMRRKVGEFATAASTQTPPSTH